MGKGEKSCKCVEAVDKELARLEKGVSVRMTIPIVRGIEPRVLVAVEKTSNTKKRKKTCAVIASYCPFCGRKYRSG